MKFLKDKIILCALSLGLFVYVLWLVGRPALGNLAYYKDLLWGYLFLLNLAIILGWYAFGRIGGAVVLFFVCVTTLMNTVRLGAYQYLWHIAIYLFTGLIGYNIDENLKLTVRLNDVELEKIEADKNLLVDKLKRERPHIEALGKKFDRFHALKNVTEQLGTKLTLDEISNLVVNNAYDVVGKSDRALLFLMDKEKQEPHLVASHRKMDLPPVKSKKGDTFDVWVMKQRKPLIIQDTKKDFRFSIDESCSTSEGVRSLISCPLMSQKKVVGILRLDSSNKGQYTAEDLRLLDIIADLGAVAVENAILYLITEELAIKDGLTGLFVHRYFKERLKEEYERANMKQYPLAMLMIDIDHFKEYNDRYGHVAGDIVLKRIAGILKEFAAPGDIVARYGGEEFAMVLLGASKVKAHDVAEDIRKKIERTEIILRRAPTQVKVSIGVAVWPGDARTEGDLIKKADTNLYKAKEAGRNRVCLCEG